MIFCVFQAPTVQGLALIPSPYLEAHGALQLLTPELITLLIAGGTGIRQLRGPQVGLEAQLQVATKSHEPSSSINLQPTLCQP